jgi:hypothetical protein
LEGLSFFLGRKGGTTTKHTMDDTQKEEDGVEVVTPGEDEVANAPEEMPAHEVPTNTSSSDEGMEADEAVGDDAATTA